MPSLKEKIIAESKRIGIDKIGFCSADPFYELEDSLHWQREMGYNSGFEHQNVKERIYPELTFENPKSIIAIALAYPTKIHEEIPEDGEKRGLFARASWGVDYHFILQDKMKQLVAFIEEEAKKAGEEDNWRFRPQVDTGEYVDTAVAQRAGIGFVGRNGLVITEEFGSWVYLGEITTNIEFEYDEEVPNGCGDCMRCVEACPTQALIGDGHLNAQRCLSYQTQTKGMMEEEYRRKIRNVVYGCDICQLVCPYNQGKDFHFHPEMEPKVDEVAPVLKPILTLTNKEFKTQFGHLAGSWRGKRTLQRNAIIALANVNDRSALPDIEMALTDERPVIRGTAAWALGRLGKKEQEKYQELLNRCLSIEENEEVKVELEKAILALEPKKRERRKKRD